MIHVPIVDTTNPSQQIEATHHSFDAPAGYWKKEPICLDHIKLTIFLEGDFSIFINDRRYRPIYGDICFLPPTQIHCGHVDSQSHLDYFQLDIGMQAHDHITDGSALLSRLIENTYHNGHFLRPHNEDDNRIIKLCHRLEHAVKKENKPLAFAYTIEILSLINQIHANSKDMPQIALSQTTTAIIHYIEEHYQERITIAQLSDMLDISATYLSLLFKKEVGLGIHAYLTEYRIMRSLSFLKDRSVADTCFLCGFCDSSHFISAFKKRFDCTPATYKKQRMLTEYTQ